MTAKRRKEERKEEKKETSSKNKNFLLMVAKNKQFLIFKFIVREIFVCIEKSFKTIFHRDKNSTVKNFLSALKRKTRNKNKKKNKEKNKLINYGGKNLKHFKNNFLFS